MIPMIAILKSRGKRWIGEAYLIVSVMFYWVMEGTVLNSLAIALFLVLMILVVSRNAILGWIIASLFLILNVYMVLAMLYELWEFPAFNKAAAELLLGGSFYLGTNIFVSVFMLIKWARKFG
jgi:hypothetical protein